MKTTRTEKSLPILIFTLCLTVMTSCGGSKKMLTEQNVIPGIDIVFVGGDVPDSVYVTVAPIPTDTTLFTKEYYEAVDNGRTDVYTVRDGCVHIHPDSVASQYQIVCDNYLLASCYMRSSEHLDFKVNDFSKCKYILSGGIYSYEIPYSKEFYDLRSKLFKIGRYKLTETELDSLICKMHSLLDIMMPECHPEAATRAAVLLDEDFIPYAYDRLPVGSEKTLYYTNVRARRNSGVRSAQQEALINSSLETDSPVPEIVLNSLDGQTFRVSELRGKWVILDFWVSWCAPCRRGFEEMKKLYDDYSGRLEIVGIACGDQYETWKNLVVGLNLPWRNMLAASPESSDGTVAGFPVPAYPTKIIIDPEGRLRDFTIGEDDGFYERFKLMAR